MRMGMELVVCQFSLVDQRVTVVTTIAHIPTMAGMDRVITSPLVTTIGTQITTTVFILGTATKDIIIPVTVTRTRTVIGIAERRRN